MPWSGQPLQAPPPPAGPALFLYPTNDSFVPKMISLTPTRNRIKIGRQTNTKTVPGDRNGYFDSKVLSRQHAEVWEESGKIYIKDVKSSNGTFVNGERLSVEGMESDPWELKSDDRVEFGIDIVGEDNKTIIHHKVAATVFCVITPEDYVRLTMHHPPAQQHHPQHQNGAYLMQGQQQRRPSLQQASSPVEIGGLSGGPALGLSGRSGKSGLTFDHILNRLQSELQKSRDTGGDLNTLATVMTDINENLVGGAQPPTHPPHHALPPVRPPQNSDLPIPSSDPGLSLSTLQSQLMQTQSALATHADKVNNLENVIAEHDHVKREVQLMRELMEQRKLEMEAILSGNRLLVNGDSSRNRKLLVAQHVEDEDDDRRSVLTVVPEENETSAMDNDEMAREERERYEDEALARDEAMGRPRTPEPHGLDEDDDEPSHRLRRQYDSTNLMPPPSNFTSHNYDVSRKARDMSSQDDLQLDLHAHNTYLSTRLETLASQLEMALNLSQTLQSQAEAAQANIERLETKVQGLESFVESSKSSILDTEAPVPNPPSTIASELWDSWCQRVEGQWRTEREEWDAERLRLQQAVLEWETRMHGFEQREQKRAADGQELFAALQHEREEVAAVATTVVAIQRSEFHRSENATTSSVNGIFKSNKSRRLSESSLSSTHVSGVKSRKRRSSAVATPPRSPSTNGDSGEQSSEEGSGSRSASSESRTSPARSKRVVNGKVNAFPLSPVPSVRQTSAGSEAELADDANSPYSQQQSGQDSSADKAQLLRHSRLGDSPLPYISVTVVFIGLAAWAFASRAND